MTEIYGVFLKAHTLIGKDELTKEDVSYIKNALSLAINAPDQAMSDGEKSYHESLVKMVYEERAINSELKGEIKKLNDKLSHRSVEQSKLIESIKTEKERDILFWVLKKQMDKDNNSLFDDER